MANINFEQEQLLTLAEAAKRVPGRTPGKPIHTATVARWATRGVRGNRLETLRIGGRLFTSVEALARFVQGMNDLDRPKPTAPAIQRQRKVIQKLSRKGL